MKDESGNSAPGWLAPIAGVVIGAAIGLWVNFKDEGDFQVVFALVGGGIGLVAGLILFVVDLARGRGKKKQEEEEEWEEPRRKSRSRSRKQDEDY